MCKKMRFDHSTPNIGSIPFSDLEAQSILSLSSEYFNFCLRSGLIKKSIPVHYRFDQSFSFIGFFDLFEYVLRRKFFFLNYMASPEVNELVCSLVDEMLCATDHQGLYGSGVITTDAILASLMHLCNNSRESWRSYWLLNGERFSSKRCSLITLDSWNTLIGLSISEIGFECCDNSAVINFSSAQKELSEALL